VDRRIEEGAVSAVERPGLHRRLYDWVLSWAETRWGATALFFLAFTESSFFPIPPDPLLMALALGKRARSFFYAFVSSTASVLGAVLGYLIGAFLWDSVRDFCFTYLFSRADFAKVAELYDRYDFWIVFAAAFTPIPFKVFTVTGGVFGINFPIFLVASAVGRSARFFLVAGLLYKFGPPIRGFIDRYFNLLSVVFVVLLVAGFVLFKFVL